MKYLVIKWLRKLQYLYNCCNFDPEYYLKKYPDVAMSGIDPLVHYRKHGWKEGRYSSLRDEIENKMDCSAYLKRYPDVAKSGMDPVVHYLRHGQHEGRKFKSIINSESVSVEELDAIKKSPYLDEGWYLSYYRGARKANMNPAMHYLINGTNGNCNPGPFFNSKEYLLLNPDVKINHLNPLSHYERWGWQERRFVSLEDIKEYQFPVDAENFSKVFRNRTSFDKHVVTVVASFSGNGKVEDYVLYLLKGLREVSDYIVIVCDNPFFKEEAAKLEKVCDACICGHHGEYDFGSYKRGIAFFEEQGVFIDTDELLLINDSCYGPVHSFASVIEKLHKLKKDFYGLSDVHTPVVHHIQSFFYLFTSKVYGSEVFREFFRKVKKEISLSNVAVKYEIPFTKILSNAGFSWGVLIPSEEFKINHTNLPHKYGQTLLRDWEYPLVKIKALIGSTIETPEDILGYIKQENHELYDVIMPHLAARRRSAKRKEVPVVSPYTLRKHYAERVMQLREKATTDKLKVVFLANISSMFAARGLMEKMLEDDLFEVELYVIPDVRFGDKEMFRLLDETYKDLSSEYPFAKLAVDIKNGEITTYHDVVKEADLVCYPSPYDLSYSLYNPYYAVKNNILSLYLSYGFPHTVYDYFLWQLYNYNNFWKVYAENQFNYEDYRRHGRCEACNAEIAGYAKMDRLSDISIKNDTTGRKKIIIAPHHSVPGGTNNVTMLSNFKKYAELFLKLPEEYPEIDFIFQPHPVLFITMRKKSQWGDAKCDEYLEKMCSLPNVEYNPERDYMEVFAQSDGIIQDCGSFLVEYFYTGKPCCYMLKEESDIENYFLDFGQECFKHCYIAYEEEDIRRYLDEVIIAGNDPKKEEREKFRREVVMLNYPHVTDVILEKLKKELADK